MVKHNLKLTIQLGDIIIISLHLLPKILLLMLSVLIFNSVSFKGQHIKECLSNIINPMGMAIKRRHRILPSNVYVGKQRGMSVHIADYKYTSRNGVQYVNHP